MFFFLDKFLELGELGQEFNHFIKKYANHCKKLSLILLKKTKTKSEIDHSCQTRSTKKNSY